MELKIKIDQISFKDIQEIKPPEILFPYPKYEYLLRKCGFWQHIEYLSGYTESGFKHEPTSLILSNYKKEVFKVKVLEWDSSYWKYGKKCFLFKVQY